MSEPEFGTRTPEQETNDSTTTTVDHVTVEKSVRRLDADTLRVEFDVAAPAAEAVQLTIEEPVPPGISLDEIGFHEDYWRNWYVEHDHLEHRIELSPGEEHFTLYGVQPTDDIDPGVFLDDPTLAVSILDTSNDTDPTDTSFDQAEPGTVDDHEPTRPSQRTPSMSASEERDNPETDPVAGQDTNSGSSVLERLAAEVESAAGDADELDVLRDAIGESTGTTEPTEKPTTSVDVRLQRVESELNELEAYRAALAEFLDEHGDGRNLMNSLQEQHEAVAASLASVTDRLDAFADRLGAVEDGLTDLEAVEQRLDELETEQTSNARLAASNQDTIADLSQTTADVESRVDAVESMHAKLTDDFDDRLHRLDESVSAIRKWQRQFVTLIEDLSVEPAEDSAESGVSTPGTAPSATRDDALGLVGNEETTNDTIDST